MIHNVSLFICAIAKFLLMTGLGIGGALALVAECCGFRVVALGFECCAGLRAEEAAQKGERHETAHRAVVRVDDCNADRNLQQFFVVCFRGRFGSDADVSPDTNAPVPSVVEQFSGRAVSQNRLFAPSDGNKPAQEVRTA